MTPFPVPVFWSDKTAKTLREGKLVGSFSGSQENASGPVGTACGLDGVVLILGDADLEGDGSALVVGQGWSAGSRVHEPSIAGHRNFGKVVDAVSLEGHSKDMITATATKTDTMIDVIVSDDAATYASFSVKDGNGVIGRIDRKLLDLLWCRSGWQAVDGAMVAALTRSATYTLLTKINAA